MNLIIENRVNDAFKKYSDNPILSKDIFDVIVNGSSDIAGNHKYLDWIINRWIKSREENPEMVTSSKENVQEVEKIKSDLSKKDNEKKKEAISISEQINGKEYSVKKLSTENNELYGSVKPTEISKLIKDENEIIIKPSMIQPITEIKSLGKFKVKVTLHSEVDAEITINVQSADSIE